MKTRIKLGLIALILASLLLGVYIGYSATPTESIWISSGVYPSAPSYTIWRDGSNYFAKDKNGQIDYSGTNLVTIAEACIGNLPQNEGKLKFARGIFVFTSTLDIGYSNIVIEGEGKATEFQAGANIGYFINISSSSQREAIIIRDVTFYNPNWATYNTTAINVDIDNNIVWHLTVNDCSFIRTNMIWTTDTSSPKALNHAVFERLWCDRPSDYALRIYDSIDVTFRDIWISNVAYDTGIYGLFLQSDVSSGVIIDGFRCFYAEYGIYLNASSNTRISNSIVDFASFAYMINGSSMVQIFNSYAHSPNGNGTGYYIDGASNNTLLNGNQAVWCNTVGFEDSSTPDGNQTLIGNMAYNSTTLFTIQAGDILRGNYGIADQG